LNAKWEIKKKFKRHYMHPGFQNGIFLIFKGLLGKGIKLNRSERADGYIEIKETVCIPIVDGVSCNILAIC